MTDPNPYSSPQSPADAGSEQIPSAGEPSLASPDASLIWSDTMWGAFTGFLMGAGAGAVSCWIVGQSPYALGALAGAPLGLIFGGLMGLRHSFVRRDPYDSNIGNTVCTLCAIPPALIVLAAGLGIAQGRFTGYLVAGMVFGFPMGGMLIGALFDRIYENILRARQ